MQDFDARYGALRAAGRSGWGGDHHPRNVARLRATLARLMQGGMLPDSPARMLEIGCGNGMSSFLLAQQGFEAHGIDLSGEAIAWAKERFAEAGLAGSFRVGDVSDMSCFPDRMFDLVFDGSCLHCLIGNDRSRCLREVRRVLRVDGVFVVSSMCGEPRSAEARAAWDADSGCLMRDGRPWRTLHPLHRLEAGIARAGFDIREVSVASNTWWDHATIVCHPSISGAAEEDS